MKPNYWIALTAFAALGGCQASDDVANKVKDNAAALDPSVTAGNASLDAPGNSIAPSASPSPSPTPTMAPVSAVVFPAEYQGSWMLRTKSCSAKPDFAIKGGTIDFGNSRFKAAKVEVTSGTSISSSGVYEKTGDKDRYDMELEDGGKKLTVSGPEMPPMTYRQCDASASSASNAKSLPAVFLGRWDMKGDQSCTRFSDQQMQVKPNVLLFTEGQATLTKINVVSERKAILDAHYVDPDNDSKEHYTATVSPDGKTLTLSGEGFDPFVYKRC